MAGLTTTMLDADLTAMRADLSQSVTWSGTAYAAIVNPLRSGDRLEMPGYLGEITCRVMIQTSLLTAGRPVAGDLVTIGAAQYRVDSVGTDEADTAVTLELVQKTGK